MKERTVILAFAAVAVALGVWIGLEAINRPEQPVVYSKELLTELRGLQLEYAKAAPENKPAVRDYLLKRVAAECDTIAALPKDISTQVFQLRQENIDEVRSVSAGVTPGPSFTAGGILYHTGTINLGDKR